MKLFLKILMVTTFFAFIPLAAGAGSLFEGSGSAIDRLKDASVGSGLGDPAQVQPSNIVQRIVNAAIGILGVVAVLLIVYAGGTWLSAAGNEQKVEQAKKIIKSTVVGIIIVGLAYAITTFIISLVAGAPTQPEPLPPLPPAPAFDPDTPLLPPA